MHDLIVFIGSNAALIVAHPAEFATFAVRFGGGGFAVGPYFFQSALPIWKAELPDEMTKSSR